MAAANMGMQPPVMAPRVEVPPVSAAVSDNLYISDLPANIEEAALQEIFGKYGTVKQCRVLQGGAALVRFASEAEATWIVENVNNNIPQGLSTPVVVKYAAPRADANKGFGGKGDFIGWGKGAWGGKGYGMYGAYWKGGWGWNPKNIRDLVRSLVGQGKLPGGRKWENDENTLFVGGLPEDTTDLELYHIFSPFGAIATRGASARLDKESMRCTGIGFVNYLDSESAQTAIRTLHGTMMSDGSTLSVKVKGPSKEPKGKGKGGEGVLMQNIPAPPPPMPSAAGMPC